MKIIAPVLAALLLAAAPVIAGGISTNLPTLSWPDDGAETVTKGCAPVLTSPGPICALEF